MHAKSERGELVLQFPRFSRNEIPWRKRGRGQGEAEEERKRERERKGENERETSWSDERIKIYLITTTTFPPAFLR